MEKVDVDLDKHNITKKTTKGTHKTYKQRTQLLGSHGIIVSSSNYALIFMHNIISMYFIVSCIQGSNKTDCTIFVLLWNLS